MNNDELPAFSTATTLYVYQGNISCHSFHHTIDVKVNIPCIEKQYCFYAQYCFECDKYIMKYSDYETYLKRFKLFPAKIHLQSNTKSSGFENNAEKSPLWLSGYNVRSDIGLTKPEREQILSSIIDYGILSKRKVLDYLDKFISNNNPNYEYAIPKWKEDKEYVLSYFEKDTPTVVIGNVKRLR